ncbi:MAG: alpha/beta hydrolase [Gammaproteobacteria bacterium]
MTELGNAGGHGAVPRAGAKSTPALAVDDGGSGGAPVLFLHSFAGDTSHWAAQLSHLRATRRALAFDFSGHGASRQSRTREYSIRTLILDVEAVVESRRLEEFVLVGHSMGATVAAGYAGSHPQNVVGLLLVDPPPAPGAMPPATVRSILEALNKDPFAFVEQYWNTQLFVNAAPAVKEKLLESLRKLPREAVVQLTTDLFHYNPVPSLSYYSGPKVAVITPQNDTGASLHRVVPEMGHVVVSGTGHWIQLDKPAEFTRLLDEFIARIEKV